MEPTDPKASTHDSAATQSGTDAVSTEVVGEAEQTDTVAGTSSHLSFFIPDLTLGGAEQVTVNIVNGLSNRGHDIDLLLSRSEGKLQSKLSSDVSVVPLSPDRPHALGVAKHLPALTSYLRREEPAALFPHLAHVSVVSLALKRAGVIDTKVVPTHHKAFGTAPDRSAKDRLVSGLVPQLYPAAERVITVSDGVAKSLESKTPVSRDDISVLHNPVEIESVRNRAETPVDHEWVEDSSTEVILFVGRIEAQKDLETWLRAFERIHDERPDTRAVIAGKGSNRDALLSLADEMGLADVVSMPGYVDNPYRYMAQASVFLLSSRYEGLPTVLIEALACGCPVVATDCPSGPREILDGGAYGELRPVGDAAGLSDAVVDTLTRPDNAAALSERADEFAPEAVIDEYERFIEEHITPV